MATYTIHGSGSTHVGIERKKERKGSKVANHVGDRGGEVNVRAKSEEKTDTQAACGCACACPSPLVHLTLHHLSPLLESLQAPLVPVLRSTPQQGVPKNNVAAASLHQKSAPFAIGNQTCCLQKLLFFGYFLLKIKSEVKRSQLLSMGNLAP